MIELALQKSMARAIGTGGPPCALLAVSEEWHQLAVSVGRRDAMTMAACALFFGELFSGDLWQTRYTPP